MPVRPEPPSHRHNAPARRWLVRLVMLFYLALLGEGVLRKWLIPGASDVLVFLRDPLMALILAVYIGMGPSRVARVAGGIAGAALLAFAFCAACQTATCALPWPVLLAGVRNYFAFVPLCFVIRDAFTAEDYRRWIGLNLALAVPIAGLVALQYGSPPGAALNAVPGGGNEGVFLVVEDVVRPYGLFSFSLGHSAFAGWMAGLGLATLVGARALRLPIWLCAPGLIGIVIMGLFSGSRTYVLFAGSVAACFVAVALIFGSNRAKLASLAAMGVGAILAVTVTVLAPSAVADLVARQDAAVASEGPTVDRIVEVGTGFLNEAARVPLFGYGLGSGTNVAAFMATGRTEHILAEYELTRIVQELGPLFGGLYILLRWGFLVWIVGLTVQAARRGNLQPACFIGFLVPVFLAHDLTLQNTIIGIGWFSAGILMAAARVGDAFHRSKVRQPRRMAWAGAAVA